MIRWNYLVPRVIILAALVTAVMLGINPLARWGLITTGQRLTGARVEIGRVASQLFRGQVGIIDLAVADPRRPSENALQCATVRLDFNTRALLDKRWVVDHGSLSGLQLGELRSSDGTLDHDEDSTSDEGSQWSDKALEAGEAWLTQAGERLATDLTSQLKSPPLARELAERWPAEYSALETRARKLRDDAQQLRTDAKTWRDEPWRAVEQLPQIATRIDRLRQEGVAIKNEVAKLKDQLARDRQSINEAREHDQQFVREHIKIDQLQPEALTEYLVRSDWKPYVDQLIGWIQWGRSHLGDAPSGPANAVPARRGLTIDLLAGHAQPRWLVKQLELDGNGTANREPFSFRGVLTGLTSDPQLTAQPARLQAQLSGAHQADIEMVIDHTQPVPRETLTIACPRIVQAPRLLGKPGGLGIELARGSGSLDVRIELAGDQLNGAVQLRRPDVALSPVVPEKYQGAMLRTALTEAAAEVKELDVRVELSGHWKRPGWRIDSSLGPQLATGMNRAVRAELVRRGDVVMGEVDAAIEKQLASWQAKFEEKQQQILADLSLSDEHLAWLKQQIASHVPLPALPNGIPSSKSAVQDALRNVFR